MPSRRMAQARRKATLPGSSKVALSTSPDDFRVDKREAVQAGRLQI
jgi:hypothetical protein